MCTRRSVSSIQFTGEMDYNGISKDDRNKMGRSREMDFGSRSHHFLAAKVANSWIYLLSFLVLIELLFSLIFCSPPLYCGWWMA